MAIVTKYTAGFPNPNALSAYSSNAHEARANIKASQFSVAIANGDSATSVLKLARVPSNAIILPDSTLFTGGVAGVTSLSVGLDNGRGTVSAAALVSAQSIAGAGSLSLMQAVAVANYGKRAWQLLGLASDPGAELDVIATLNTAATADGLIAGWLRFTLPGL